MASNSELLAWRRENAPHMYEPMRPPLSAAGAALRDAVAPMVREALAAGMPLAEVSAALWGAQDVALFAP